MAKHLSRGDAINYEIFEHQRFRAIIQRIQQRVNPQPQGAPSLTLFQKLHPIIRLRPRGKIDFARNAAIRLSWREEQ